MLGDPCTMLILALDEFLYHFSCDSVITKVACQLINRSDTAFGKLLVSLFKKLLGVFVDLLRDKAKSGLSTESNNSCSAFLSFFKLLLCFLLAVIGEFSESLTTEDRFVDRVCPGSGIPRNSQVGRLHGKDLQRVYRPVKL